MLLGHTKQINGVWKIQSLKQHSENVAEYCARACQPLGLENLGRLTGWLHDAGKSHSNVQKHLRGQTNEKINHSSAGMRWRRNSFTTFSLDCANGSIGNRIPSL